jgi:hypothetical protein
MTNLIHADVSLSNVHPADALAEIRAEIKALQVREAFFRSKLMADGANLVGEAYEANIDHQKTMRLDQEKLAKALGDLEPFKSENVMVMVRVKKRK